MTSEALLERAEQLANRIAHSAPGARWEIAGGVGSGKSTLLYCLIPALSAHGLHPILVSPPTEAMDAGPAAMIQLGAGLQMGGLINGELDKLRDPQITWSEKLDVTSQWISSNQDAVVLLGDEPDRWPIADDAEARHASYNNGHTREIAGWLKQQALCRRVIATPWSKPGESVEPYSLPRADLPLLDLPLGPLHTIATELKHRLGARLSQVNYLEMKLLVAFATVTSIDQAVSRQADWPNSSQLAHSVIGAISGDDQWSPLLPVLGKVALARGPVTMALLERLGINDVGDNLRNVLIHGMLQASDQSYAFHPVLRTVVSMRAGLEGDQRLNAHRSIMEYYRDCIQAQGAPPISASECEVEGFHHAASCGERGSGLHAFFVDQLHTLGRVLSKEHHDYDAAADVFRQAIEYDDRDDYAHHYRGYNLDCAARDRPLIREEYLRAIELNSDHPWWWSRWVNFLITTGRLREAKQEWSRAMDALGTADGRASDVVYEHLHLYVARLLLHRVQLDFADEVLAEAPADLRLTHTRFRALDRLLEAMKIARRERGVFPVNVDPKDYWKHPHCAFPERIAGEEMEQWNPARVESVEGQTIRLVVGKHDEKTGKTTYGQIDLDVARFNEASPDQKAYQLVPGRLLELGFYGKEGILRIAVHPDTPYTDPDLPFIDPPNPRRYLESKPK